MERGLPFLSMQLAIEQFERIFPFYLEFDSSLRVTRVGPSLKRLADCAPQEMVGLSVEQIFNFVRPHQDWSVELLLASKEIVFVVELRVRPIKLRGQIVTQPGGGFVFLGAPWATSLEELKDAGISLFTDFAVHDPTVDLLHLVQLQRMTQEDQGRLVERLSTQQSELRIASDKLTQELSERIRAEAMTRSILDTAADAIVVIDESGLIQSINPAFESLFGYRAHEVVGRNVTVLMNPDDAQHHDGYVQSYLDTGIAHIIGTGREVTGRRKDGSSFPLFLSVGAVNVEGQRRFTGIMRDITQQKLEKERLQVQESRLRSILAHMLEALLYFDWDGRLKLCNPVAVELLCLDPNLALEQDLQQIQSTNSLSASLLSGISPAESMDVPTRVDEVRCDGRFLEREFVAVPLGNARIGTLVLLRDITERRKVQEALIQVRQHEVEIAGQIQQTLLYGTTPIGLLGIDFAVLTRPSQAVDGDFFEFYRYGAETIDLVIADVMGKGIAAALLGAAAKTHLQGAAAALLGERECGSVAHPSPAAIVNRLHGVLSHQLISLNRFITLCYARFDLRRRVLEYVDCGHPPTLLIRQDGTTQSLEGDNVPLGFLPQERYGSQSVALNTGDTLVFYSDGLTEATSKDGELFGVDRLTEFFSSHAHLEIRAQVEGLKRKLAGFLGGVGPADDLTCVIARIGEPLKEIVRGQRSLEFSSDLNELPIIRQFVSDLLDSYFLDADEVESYSLTLAVNEAVSNIIRHGYQSRKDGWIYLDGRVGEDWIGFRLYHKGTPLQQQRLDQVLPINEPQEGGMGLFLITSYCDEVTVSSDPEGVHCFSMLRKMPPDPAAQSEHP